MKPKKQLNDYARYSAIGLQMAAFIVLTTFAGRWLDSFGWINFPVFMVAGVIFGVIGSMVYLIRQF